MFQGMKATTKAATPCFSATRRTVGSFMVTSLGQPGTRLASARLLRRSLWQTSEGAGKLSLTSAQAVVPGWRPGGAGAVAAAMSVGQAPAADCPKRPEQHSGACSGHRHGTGTQASLRLTQVTRL